MADVASTVELDVQELAGHWMARFVENGVPLDDYLRTTAPLRRWSEWCHAWATTADAQADAADRALARGAVLTAAELRLVAALEYHFAKFLFVHDMQTLRAVHARAVHSYRQAMVALPWPGETLDVAFADTLLQGIIRRPHGTAPFPAVLLIPGLDATKEELHRIEDVFLRRGMATFAIDGPGQGEAEYELPLRPDWEHVAAAVLDTLAPRDDIDAERIAAVGVSLGGYFAARAACAEPRLRAAASIGGCFSMGEAWPMLSPLTRRAFEVRSGSQGPADAAEAAHRFTLASAEPVADVPFLVLHGGRDRLFDVEQARRLAQHLGDRATLVVEPEGNHVLHNLAASARPFVADWVASALDGTASRRAGRDDAAPAPPPASGRRAGHGASPALAGARLEHLGRDRARAPARRLGAHLRPAGTRAVVRSPRR